MSNRKPRAAGTLPFTARQIERMREMKDEGNSLEDIARIMGTSKNTVVRLTKGIPPAGFASSRPSPKFEARGAE